ncbi:mating-type protein Mat a-1, partial [Lasiosphaeria ovina]
KIPRPPNAFILYRKDRHKELKNANPALKNNEISTIVGAMWRRETEEIRTEYFLKAQECKNQLLKYYPQYKYTPRRSADIRR